MSFGCLYYEKKKDSYLLISLQPEFCGRKIEHENFLTKFYGLWYVKTYLLYK